MRPNRIGSGVPSRDRYRDDEIGIDAWGSCPQVLVRRVKVLFPPDGFIRMRSLNTSFRPGSDVVDPLPLDRDIAGRRDEHPYL